jgi:hypothetical protein
MDNAVLAREITPNAAASATDGYFLYEGPEGLASKFGGRMLSRLILMEWPLDKEGKKIRLSLNALVFEHGKALLVETLFMEQTGDKADVSETYVGSSHCYRLNIPVDAYTEERDEDIMRAIYQQELGLESSET